MYDFSFSLLKDARDTAGASVETTVLSTGILHRCFKKEDFFEL
jgi:hypothetical protein